MSQSAKLAAVHSRTTIAPAAPIGAACFHRTASRYVLPADRADAPTARSSKCGCCWISRMKRWPTEPVAPRTPVARSRQSPHRTAPCRVHVLLSRTARFARELGCHGRRWGPGLSRTNAGTKSDGSGGRRQVGDTKLASPRYVLDLFFFCLRAVQRTSSPAGRYRSPPPK